MSKSKSEYLEKAKTAKELCSAGDTFYADYLLIEKLDIGDEDGYQRRKSGLITAIEDKSIKGAMDQDPPQFATVLDTGEGTIGADGEVEPTSCDPGNIILINKNDARYFSRLPINDYSIGRIGLTRDTSVIRRWESYDDWQKYWDAFDTESKENDEK